MDPRSPRIVPSNAHLAIVDVQGDEIPGAHVAYMRVGTLGVGPVIRQPSRRLKIFVQIVECREVDESCSFELQTVPPVAG